MADIITDTQLTTFLPGLSNAPQWTSALNTAMDRFEINTTRRAAAFLAQVAHESGELQRLVENLSYSAARLCAVWPNRFATPDVAKPYERNPEGRANFVYAKRLGNGDTASGDGWRFRGRGLIQLTGCGNCRSCGLALTLPLETEPERLEPRSASSKGRPPPDAVHGRRTFQARQGRGHLPPVPRTRPHGA